ncbi:hypothetical protein CGMCC3_g4066 [Colletotrichum fructicola]|nr:uncharacterized protein CGMCC3_g4066 [Colletotrichum fructicola]KAE9579896.1 hypothetical protein CGMCC3_g4066 [Colletotrichum fructicola]
MSMSSWQRSPQFIARVLSAFSCLDVPREPPSRSSENSFKSLMIFPMRTFSTSMKAMTPEATPMAVAGSITEPDKTCDSFPFQKRGSAYA